MRTQDKNLRKGGSPGRSRGSHAMAASIKRLFAEIGEAEPEIYRQAILKGLKAGARDSFPFIRLAAASQEFPDLEAGRGNKLFTGDDRTCPICEPLDGTHVPIDEFSSHPAFHVRCRCTIGLVDKRNDSDGGSK